MTSSGTFIVNIATDVGNGKINTGVNFYSRPISTRQVIVAAEELYTTELRDYHTRLASWGEDIGGGGGASPPQPRFTCVLALVMANPNAPATRASSTTASLVSSTASVGGSAAAAEKWQEFTDPAQLYNNCQLYVFDTNSPAPERGVIPRAQLVVDADRIPSVAVSALSRGNSLLRPSESGGYQNNYSSGRGGGVGPSPRLPAAGQQHTQQQLSSRYAGINNSTAAAATASSIAGEATSPLPHHVQQQQVAAAQPLPKTSDRAACRQYLFRQLKDRCGAGTPNNASIPAQSLHGIFVQNEMFFSTETFSDMTNGQLYIGEKDWAALEEHFAPVLDVLFDRIAAKTAQKTQSGADEDKKKAALANVTAAKDRSSRSGSLSKPPTSPSKAAVAAAKSNGSQSSHTAAAANDGSPISFTTTTPRGGGGHNGSGASSPASSIHFTVERSLTKRSGSQQGASSPNHLMKMASGADSEYEFQSEGCPTPQATRESKASTTPQTTSENKDHNSSESRRRSSAVSFEPHHAATGNADGTNDDRSHLHRSSRSQSQRSSTATSQSSEEMEPFVIPSAENTARGGGQHNAHHQQQHQSSRHADPYTSTSSALVVTGGGRNHSYDVVSVRNPHAGTTRWQQRQDAIQAEQRLREEREIASQWRDLTFQPNIHSHPGSGGGGVYSEIPFEERLSRPKQPAKRAPRPADKEETFRPRLNPKSEQMIADNRIPLGDKAIMAQRKVRDRKAQEEMERQAKEEEDAKRRKNAKINTDFFSRLSNQKTRRSTFQHPDETFKPKVSAYANQMRRPNDVSFTCFDAKHPPPAAVAGGGSPYGGGEYDGEEGYEDEEEHYSEERYYQHEAGGGGDGGYNASYFSGSRRSFGGRYYGKNTPNNNSCHSTSGMSADHRHQHDEQREYDDGHAAAAASHQRRTEQFRDDENGDHSRDGRGDLAADVTGTYYDDEPQHHHQQQQQRYSGQDDHHRRYADDASPSVADDRSISNDANNRTQKPIVVAANDAERHSPAPTTLQKQPQNTSNNNRHQPQQQQRRPEPVQARDDDDDSSSLASSSELTTSSTLSSSDDDNDINDPNSARNRRARVLAAAKLRDSQRQQQQGGSHGSSHNGTISTGRSTNSGDYNRQNSPIRTTNKVPNCTVAIV